MRDLNHLYRDTSALYEVDFDARGFEWIDCADDEQGVISFTRRAGNGDDLVVVVCNLTPVPRGDYRIGVPRAGNYVERINTDATDYQGSGVGNFGGVHSEDLGVHGHAQSLRLSLPPLATLILQPA